MSFPNFDNYSKTSVLGRDKNSATTLYIETTKSENLFDETKTIKKAKTTKRVLLKTHAFKNHAHTYNIEILNSFYLELQLTNSE